MAEKALESVLPGNDIDVSKPVAELSLTQRQMIEIARAAQNPIARRLGRSKPLIEAPQRKTVGVAGLVDMDSPQGKEELIEQFIINWNNLHGFAGTVYKSEIPGLIRKLVAEHSVQKVLDGM